MRHRSRPVLLLIAAATTGGTAPAAGDVSATVTGLRSSRGQVLACLTMRPDAFPDCAKDPDAHRLAVPAGTSVQLDFGAVPQGRYAVSLVHDENGNGRLDTRLMIPREGFGFSRDAPVRMGPPRFERAAFPVEAHAVQLEIRMRYIL